MISFASRATRGALVLGLTTALLSGCAQEPPPPTNLAEIKTLGVLSFCGESVRRETMSLPTTSPYTSSDLRVPDWKLDAHILEGIQSKAPPGMTVTRMPPNTLIAVQAIRQKDKSERAYMWQLLFASDVPRKDSYLVIFPAYTGTYWEDEQAKISPDYQDNRRLGFGIFSRGAYAELHASCGAFLYDPNLSQVVRRHGFDHIENVPDRLLKAQWSDYSAAEIAQARAVMEPMATTYGRDLMTMILADSATARQPRR